MPQLGTVARLGQQEGHQLVGLDGAARRLHAEVLLGDVPGEHAGVVSIPLDRTRVAWDAVLSKATRSLHDGARKKNL